MIHTSTHYGHWRGTLRIACDLAINESRNEETKFSTRCSSIVLARTSLEIFLNESWFSIPGNSSVQPSFKRYVNKTIVDRFKEFARIVKITDHTELNELYLDIDITNQIRNFCIHYTGPQIKQITSKAIKKRPQLNDLCLNVSGSPQTFLVNEHSVRFCLNSVVRAISFIEQNRATKTPLSAEYVDFCEGVNA